MYNRNFNKRSITVATARTTKQKVIFRKIMSQTAIEVVAKSAMITTINVKYDSNKKFHTNIYKNDRKQQRKPNGK